jgi:WD40 repeat protein
MLPFAFTPEGDELILRTQSGVQFIDLQGGAEIAFLPSAQTVVAAALSPDGDTLAWSLADNTIQLLDIPGGELRATLEGHPDSVYTWNSTTQETGSGVSRERQTGIPRGIRFRP